MSPPAPTVRAEHALSTDHGSTCNQTGTRSLLQLSLFSYFLQHMCEFRLCNHSTDNSANSAFTKFFEDYSWHDLRRSNQRNRLLKQKIHQWSRPAGTDPKQTFFNHAVNPRKARSQPGCALPGDALRLSLRYVELSPFRQRQQGAAGLRVVFAVSV
jgi:hypothetical protein